MTRHTTTSHDTSRRPIILLFGDSITQGGFDPQTGRSDEISRE